MLRCNYEGQFKIYCDRLFKYMLLCIGNGGNGGNAGSCTGGAGGKRITMQTYKLIINILDNNTKYLNFLIILT